MACKGPDNPISARLPVSCFGRRFEAPKARFFLGGAAELSFLGQGTLFGGQGPFFWSRSPFFGGKGALGAPKRRRCPRKRRACGFLCLFCGKGALGLPQDAFALKTELWAPRGRTIKRSRKGLSTQPNAGRIHGFPGNFPTGVYGIEATVGFLSISGAFLASREAFFGARAREKSRKKRRFARTEGHPVRRWKSRSKSQAVSQMAMLRHISERHFNQWNGSLRS